MIAPAAWSQHGEIWLNSNASTSPFTITMEATYDQVWGKNGDYILYTGDEASNSPVTVSNVKYTWDNDLRYIKMQVLVPDANLKGLDFVNDGGAYGNFDDAPQYGYGKYKFTIGSKTFYIDFRDRDYFGSTCSPTYYTHGTNEDLYLHVFGSQIILANEALSGPSDPPSEYAVTVTNGATYTIWGLKGKLEMCNGGEPDDNFDPPVVAVNVTGPFSLGYKDLGAYSATVNGLGSSHSHGWYRRCGSSGGWIQVTGCPLNSCSINMMCSSGYQEIKLSVTSGSGSGSDIHRTYAGLSRAAAALSEAPGEQPADLSSSSQSIALSAYPNPFNPEAVINVTVGETQHVRVHVVDLQGRHVATLYDGSIVAGETRGLRFDGTRLPSGTYFVRVLGDLDTFTHRVVLAK